MGFSSWSTHTWTPWGEYPDGFGFENVVEVLIPESGTDTFWSDYETKIIKPELIEKLEAAIVEIRALRASVE